MPKPRVFVSSVVEGFEELREAARHGVQDAGGEPVLVNEDFPSLPTSPRNACLGGVESCDIYVCIVGSRGGWTAPSGKLVTEEEYEHAVQLGVPVLAFVVDGDRDAEASRFEARLSDYVQGRFRKVVENARDLRASVAQSLTPLIAGLVLPMTPLEAIGEALSERVPLSNETLLRIVIAPERDEELVDPVKLSDRDFQDQVLRIGHESSVQLFDYRFAKEQTVTVECLLTHQDGTAGPRDESRHLWLDLCRSGRVRADGNVSGRTRHGAGGDFLGAMVVAEEDIAAVALAVLRYYGRLLEELDKYGRHQNFLVNAAMLNLGYRTIARAPKPRGSYPVRMASGDAPIVAFDEPRRLGRAQLADPGAEVARMVTMLARRAAR